MELEALRGLVGKLRSEFAGPVEFPEPAPRLDLESRKDDQVRQFKHLHQACLGHAMHLVVGNKLKLLGLLEGYELSIETRNVLGHYLFGRSVLELCAFLLETSDRLSSILAKPESAWKPKGEEFFSLLVRARFGTGDPTLRARMEKVGFPARLLKPLNVSSSLDSLRRRPELSSLNVSYDRFCDFVHQNGPSHYVASSGFYQSRTATHAGGGMIVTSQPGPVSVYEYPNAAKASVALVDTLEPVGRAAAECTRSLDNFPISPFSPAQVAAITGTPLGATFLGFRV